MLFHPTVSLVALNVRFYCRLKLQQPVITRSVNFLSFQNVLCEKTLNLSPKLVFTRNIRRRKRVDPPTDFLPFPWVRKKKFCYIEGSGDTIRTVDLDPKLCKWDADLTELFEGLDDNVRKLFSLETMVNSDLLEVNKQILLKKVQQHPLDFDSREVRIALQTLKVRSLLVNHTAHPRRTAVKVFLIRSIQKRNHMLIMLRKADLPRYEWLVKELGINFTPPLPGVVAERYTRKNELRRLTKEYCEKMVKEKRDEYHAKLKEEQQSFLKEKEEILAWIAKEEEELGITKSDNS